jgi:hypothetical protein
MIMGPRRPIGVWIKVKNPLGAGEPATDRSSSDIGFEKSAKKMTLAPIEQAERHVAEGERHIPKQRPYRFTHENEYRSPGARFTEPLAVSPALLHSCLEAKVCPESTVWTWPLSRKWRMRAKVTLAPINALLSNVLDIFRIERRNALIRFASAPQ